MAKSNALPIEYLHATFKDLGEMFSWVEGISEWSTDHLYRLQSIHIFKTKDGMWHGTACLEKEQK